MDAPSIEVNFELRGWFSFTWGASSSKARFSISKVQAHYGGITPTVMAASMSVWRERSRLALDGCNRSIGVYIAALPVQLFGS